MKTYAIVGVSGVGKSTFTKALKERGTINVFSASNLIKLSKAESNDREVEHDKLRLGNIDDNQIHLISGYNKIRLESTGNIIIEAHAIIDTPSGLSKISSEVFSALSISHIFHLYVPADRIFEFRKHDHGRNRPRLSIADINEHQDISLSHSSQVSHDLGVPMTVINQSHSSYFYNIVQS